MGDDVDTHTQTIGQVLSQAGVDVRSMDLIPPSLEDVFIANVRRNGTGTE